MLLRLLPAISREEKRDLLNRMKAFFDGDTSSATKVATEEDLIYEATIKALEKVTHNVTYRPLSVITGDALKKFNEVALGLHRWIDQWVPNLTRSERHSLFLMLADLAVAQARVMRDKDGQPRVLSPSLVFERLQSPGELVDAAFPGYLEAGHFHLVIKQRLKGPGDVR